MTAEMTRSGGTVVAEVEGDMDDFFGDDPFDIASPEGIVLAAGSGVLDDERPCECHVDCGCERTVEWPEDECEACRDDRHRDPFDPDDRRGDEWP